MKKRLTAGFTLTEVMVAGTIFLIFAIAFLGALTASMKSQQLSVNYYRGMCLARNRIQRARTMEYYSLPLMRETAVAIDQDGNLSTTGSYQRTTIVNIISNGAPNLAEVTVQIKYIGAGRVLSAQPVQLSTMLTEKM